LIRDGLVEQIWEGTMNILALDLMRAVREEKDIQKFVKVNISAILHNYLSDLTIHSGVME
jgi:hypothetical protein